MNTVRTLRIPLIAMLVVGVLLTGLWERATPASAAASITVSPSVVPQGSPVKVTGNGFTPNDAVVIYFDAPVNNHNQRIHTSVTTDNSGAFATGLRVPRGTFPTDYKLTAADSHQVAATQAIGVQAALLIRTDGSNPWTSALGQHNVRVNAAGFAANEPLKIQITFPNYSGNDIIATKNVTANAKGNYFGALFDVPAGAKIGWATVTATGQTDNKTAQGRVYVTYRPSISLRSSSVMAGSQAVVTGRGFVANALVRVRVTVNSNSGAQTVSVDATTNGKGNFTKYVRIPNYASSGTYTVTAISVDTGLRRTAKLSIFTRSQPRPTATPKPTSAPKPTATPAPTSKPSLHYHPLARVVPGTTLPNQNVAVAGTGYPGDTSITVSLSVNLTDGSNRTVRKSATTDSSGRFTLSFRVPYKTSPGTYAVSASGGGQSDSSTLHVLPLTAKPANLNFKWVSLWYHSVRQGTYDVITIQSTLQTELGIWIHVIFPGGQHWDYYKGTDNSGQYSVKFTIPHGSTTRQSNQAYITLQLWHGKQTTQSFVSFSLV